ncbi:hypothetical protein LIER_40779 [Lithospermum erythrorhizon]|uniref:RNase H type-1 domain-containing protein n=1 Tax=Lithospermum erythrorhizon TaxID=34254 RepID=A0AAV3R2K2_LITER
MTAWAMELSEFDITYAPRTNIKAQVLADFIIECTARQPLKIDGPREPQKSAHIPEWVVYVDGERNSKGSGAGIMIQGPDQVKMEYALTFSFKATNNEEEYEAMIAGLMLVKSLGVLRVVVRGDSKLVMDQINGECGVKNETLMRYHEKAVTMAKGFNQTIFQHIPRAQNEEADRLFQLATTYYDELPKEVYIELRKHHSYEENALSTVLEEPEDWRTPIAKYLTLGNLSSEKAEAKETQNRSYKFHMYQEELYKKSVEGPLLLCVSAENISKVLFEVHNDWCGSHIGGRSLALKITRTGFFWPTLSKDAMMYVKICDACQRLSNTPQKAVVAATPVISPIPFAIWGICLVGKLPKAKGGVEYVVVVVDYFSKWVEVAPLKKIKRDNIVHLV